MDSHRHRLRACDAEPARAARGPAESTVIVTPTLCERLRIAVPIFNAPMTPQAGGALARAVSDAGAFGMLGFDEDESEAAIAKQLELLRGAGKRANFGIGLVVWVLERRPHLFDIAIAAEPKLVSVSFGDPAPYVERLHAAGILVATQVQNHASAQQALDAGVDVLVAQGTEAGGHTGNVATLPLLQIVLEMTDRPVLAAGGIATGRGLAAVLAAGAAGAWIGTPFLLASESRSTPQAQARIIESDETQTLYTSAYDRAQGKPWPQTIRGRALRHPLLERWDGHEDELSRTPDAIAEFVRSKVYAGQSVGALHRVEPAAAIVQRIASQAEECLRGAGVGTSSGMGVRRGSGGPL